MDNKLQNPHYFIWSNKPDEYKELFLDQKKFTFIENNIFLQIFIFFLFVKILLWSFYFSLVGAWLNENSKNLSKAQRHNPSNNKDFWTKDWISI